MDAAIASDARTEIRERYNRFEEHFANGDAAAIVSSYYVDKPLLSAPDTALIRDRAGIEALFAEIMKVASAVRFETIEFQQSGDLGYEIGRAFLTMRDGSGPQTECRTMVVWRRTPDGWRAEADFFAYGSLL